MRPSIAVVALLFVATAANAAVGDDDDPKRARLAASDEDDPKLARAHTAGAVAAPPRVLASEHPVPRVKLGYRRQSTVGLENDSIDWHGVDLEFYPVSRRWFRLGIAGQLAFGTAYGAWSFQTGLSAGFQYPWRVTPFVEGRFSAGLIGGRYEGAGLVSWIYTGGIEGGVEIYLVKRFYLTAAVGWAHLVFSGIDTEFVRSHPGIAPRRKDFASDTFTFRVGFGL
jgi:hypothetical protein